VTPGRELADLSRAPVGLAGLEETSGDCHESTKFVDPARECGLLVSALAMGAPSESVAPPPTNGPDPLIGTLIHGKYRIRSLLARGGMGSVYKAEQEPLGRQVAIKILRGVTTDGTEATGSEQDKQFRARFLREASALARLSHPSIVTVYDYGRIDETSERCFMAMEFVPGDTLHRRLANRKPLPLTETLQLLDDVASALRVAHAGGIVHRDLKPSNIILAKNADCEDRAKIVDFGIVKVIGDGEVDQDLTQEGVCMGSPRYMSPEQIAGSKVDRRTDIYALGIIMFQCLTGRVPFEAGNTVSVMMQHVNAPIPPLRDVCADTPAPEWLEQLVRNCLEKNPANRPQSADEILQVLRRHMSATMPLTPEADANELAARPEHTTPSPVSLPRPTIRKKRRWPLVLVAGVLAAAAAVPTLRRKAAQSSAPGPTVSAPTIASSPHDESFALRIKAEPAGTVDDNGVTVGVTPLVRRYSHNELQAAAHTLVVHAPGFEPVTFVQGDSDADLERDLVLIASPHPSSTPSSPTQPARSWVPSSPRNAPTATTSAPPPVQTSTGDLIMHR